MQTGWWVDDNRAEGKTAETVGKYVKKGDKLYIEGKIRNRNYEVEGVKKYFTEIVADSFTFLNSKKESDGPPDEEPASHQAKSNGTAKPAAKTPAKPATKSTA